jgi:hypothetical protein
MEKILSDANLEALFQSKIYHDGNEKVYFVFYEADHPWRGPSWDSQKVHSLAALKEILARFIIGRYQNDDPNFDDLSEKDFRYEVVRDGCSMVLGILTLFEKKPFEETGLVYDASEDELPCAIR